MSYDWEQLLDGLARLIREPVARPLLGIALLLGASRLLLALVNSACRRCRWSAEAARKSLHAGMGTLLLTCPWLFDRAWPVVALAGVYIGLLAARHVLSPLRYHVAGVIYAVQRQSRGEYYFPIVVAILFAVSRGDALGFCIPVALLAYADAAAAIVGARYGQTRFTVGRGCKSLEGCAAFAATALVVCHVPLLLSGRVSPAASLLIAANLAITTAALEAACWHGLDNLAVPLLAFVLLHAMLAMPVRALAACLIGAAAMTIFVVIAISASRADHAGRVARVDSF